MKKPRCSKFSHEIDVNNTIAVTQKTVTLTLQSSHETETDGEEFSTATSIMTGSTMQSAASTQPRYGAFCS